MITTAKLQKRLDKQIAAWGEFAANDQFAGMMPGHVQPIDLGQRQDHRHVDQSAADNIGDGHGIQRDGHRLERCETPDGLIRVFLAQLTEKNFAEMNAVYKEFFAGDYPARTTVGAQLMNMLVEIECVVRLDA